MQIIFTGEAQQVPFGCAEKAGSVRERFAVLPEVGEEWLYSDSNQDSFGARGEVEYCATMDDSTYLEMDRKRWHRLQTLLCLFFLDVVPHDIEDEDEVIGGNLGALLAIHPDFSGILIPSVVDSLAEDLRLVNEDFLLGALLPFPGSYDNLFQSLRSGILAAASRGGIVVISD